MKGNFSLAVSQFVEQAKENMDEVKRSVVLQLASEIVERSPVGDKERWAVNKHSKYGRETHNLWVDEINQQIMSDPANLTKSGNLKRGIKKARRLGKKKLAEAYPIRGPKGYIGGHFRANWQIALDQPASGILDEIDAQGIATKNRLTAEVESIYAGSVAHITNNLPYGPRLEFEAWSSQAPQGMVRITVAEFQTMVNNAVKEVTSK